MYSPRQIGVLALGLMLYACATTPELSKQEIDQQFPSLASFGDQLESARDNRVDLLAPENFKEAMEQYDTASEAASKNQEETTISAVTKGMEALRKAERDANVSNEIFAEVRNAREKAMQAGADQLFAEQLSSLDSKLSEASTLIEEGKIDEAKQRRPDLQREYSDLELLALKQDTTLRAKAALAKAKENDAHKLAPKTFAQAEEELRLAESILDIDRTKIDKANEHATLATVLSSRSNNIAEVVKEFDRRDFSNEDIVLWHQNELATVASPLGEVINFDEPDDKVVNSLHQQVSDVVAANNASQEKIAQLNQQHAQELASLNSQFQSEIAKQETMRSDIAAMEVARESRFDRISEMFKENEAKVYREKNNVLLSVYGFDFPPGNADIKSNNFALMDKIVKSIAEFKDAKVVVSGHTDMTGTAELNQNLSQKRAENVARFLNEVGGIPADRIVAEGYGETKPVANNETPEGRSLNRRVDILIVNE